MSIRCNNLSLITEPTKIRMHGYYIRKKIIKKLKFGLKKHFLMEAKKTQLL